ncbi:hypothetical protein Ahy_B02g061245 [Arachis hypogaea]|uniref:Uncharacterized protein n=1 Tax=Arachis hypogaea TaxID=3818 RepID=A0A445AKP3_ARAHY|nr:hypothetical protein Ahy_B02g061245 [Arachis hypogaea]
MASLSLNVVSVPPRTTTISCTRTRVPSLPFSFTRRRLTIRATETDTNNVKSQAPDKAPSKDGSSINQLLGIKGAAQESAGHDFPIVFYLAVGGSLLSYIYSAPPLKLKQNGWIGNFALGASYISLPWWAGQALFGTLTSDIIVLTLLYSIAGLGIAIVNDFKSVEGDRALGLQVNSVTLFLSITVT